MKVKLKPMSDNIKNPSISIKQELINNLIWVLIANSIFAHFGKQMEKGTASTFGVVIWFISAFFLFGALIAFTKIFSKSLKNIVASFVVALFMLLIVNFILLAIVP